MVAFHIKINEQFNGLETGLLARDVVRSENGRWSYYENNIRLNVNDKVYYWMYVIYNGRGYNFFGQEYTVQGKSLFDV